MLNTWQDATIVIAVVCLTLFFQLLLERVWPRRRRQEHNDIIGWQLGILGTTYAVILGFMLYTVWTNFGLAEINADAEANSATNIFRLAEGLPDPQRNQVREAIRAYVDVVIEKDWPEMERAGTGLLESHRLNQTLWHIFGTIRAATPEQLTSEDHALYEMSSLAEHRRIRLLQSTSRLPGILWWVLLVGGVVTIVSACLMGGTNGPLHTFQVLCFSLLIGLVLVAIADIDRPFQGSVHVGDEPFRRAQMNMNEP